MFTYDENNKFFKKFGDDLILFSVKLPTGVGFSYPSPVSEPSLTTNLSILSKGTIKTTNPNRVDDLDIHGGPGRIFGGLMLPGVYTIESIGSEDAVYTCLSRHNPLAGVNASQLPTMVWDFDLDIKSLLTNGDTFTLVQEGRFEWVVVMHGEVTITAPGRSDTTISEGQGFKMAMGETIQITNTGSTWADIGWAKPKSDPVLSAPGISDDN